MFRTVPLFIIRSFSLYIQQWYMSYRFADTLRAGSGSGRSVLILFASCMTHTIAVCTVKNSWWWTEELSETCRVLFQKKFEKLVHLVGFIIRIYHDARSPERQIRLQLYWKKLIRLCVMVIHCPALIIWSTVLLYLPLAATFEKSYIFQHSEFMCFLLN